MGQVYVGQIGLKIELDTLDLMSGATTQEIKYKKPSGAIGSWTATQDGTKLYYITTDPVDSAALDDLDESGTWYLQSYAAGADWSILGEAVTLDVLSAFMVPRT